MNKRLTISLIITAIFFGIIINLLFISTGIESFGERASYMVAPLEFIAVIVVGTLIAPYLNRTGFSKFVQFVSYTSFFWITVFIIDYLGFFITCPFFKDTLPNLYNDPMSLCQREDLLLTQIVFVFVFGMFFQILSYVEIEFT